MDYILEVKDLVVDYGIIRAIKGIDLKIPAGKIVTIVGSNGAGKTTTLRTISGMTKSTSGHILLEGEDIRGKEPYVIARRGISQSPEGRMVLGGLTTEENLQVGAYNMKSKETVRRNYEMVYDLFPILKERAKQQATTLSGGEQQMLAIGRALMSNPKVLLLDEPSLGLAPLIVKSIFKAIKKIAADGVTVLLVEQNARQSLRIADYAYVLEIVKIKTEGDSKTLMQDKTLLQAYLGEQQ